MNDKRWIILILILYKPGFCLAAYAPSSEGPRAEVHPEVLNLQASFAKVAELVKPAVVSISTVHTESMQESPEFFFGDPFEEFFQQFFGGNGQGQPPFARPRSLPRAAPRQYKLEGMGSGVIIDAEGLVLTNEHVVRGADQIKVTVYEKDGQKRDYTGRVVGKDARTDIAVVRIHAGRKLPFAALGDSDNVHVGDWAIAIGSPFGLTQTVTAGIIPATRQSLSIEGRDYRDLLQTDAAINRGNSGGPLLNIRGEVTGINTAIYAPTGVFAGIGFAVPVNQAKAILSDLVQKGHVVRGWLGVELAHEITPAMVKAFGLPDTKGALVNGVLKNSPAEKAGLQRGDVIRAFNGKPVENSNDLQARVAETAPKQSIPLAVIRNHQPTPLTLITGERPESADTRASEPAEPQQKREKSQEKTWLGAKVAPKDNEGVLVLDVEAGSQAEDMGLQPGDVIRAVNQVPTATPEAFLNAVKKVDLSDGIVLDVLRQGHALYLSYARTKE